MSSISPAELKASVTFNGVPWNTKLGEGATGEVFRGVLDDAPVAVKRLRLSPHAPREAIEALQRRFRAELATLSSFQHPRLVKLLRSCEDPGSGIHPFSLVFELLEEGSLADWLRSERGEKSIRGVLPPLARIDAAIGVAQGLAYLHVNLQGEEEARDMEEEGVAVVRAGVPTVHRDVKSANVGFTRIGGALYAKILDCGLAKALRGDAGQALGGGGAAASFSVGVLGTPGYMAPELTDGSYTVASEVYSFGVVLLELVLGQRVKSDTGQKVRRSVEDAGGQVEQLCALFDPIWPDRVKKPLAVLIANCLMTRDDKRPQSMDEILEPLRSIKTLLAPVGDEPVIKVLCPICQEEMEEGEGIWCKAAPPAPRHFMCHGCLQGHASANSGIDKLLASNHGVACYEPQCPSLPWTLEELSPHLDAQTAVQLAIGIRKALADLPALLALRARELQAKEEEARRSANQAEKVRKLRLLVVEEDLTLHCPRCNKAFIDFEGCAALKCGDNVNCGAGFCAICLKVFGRDAHTHVREVHAPTNPINAAHLAADNPRMYYFSPGYYNDHHKKLRLDKLAARLRGLAIEGPGVQRDLLAELGRQDLPGVGILVSDIERLIGVVPAGGNGGGGGGGGGVLHGNPGFLPIPRPIPVDMVGIGGGRGGGGGGYFPANPYIPFPRPVAQPRGGCSRCRAKKCHAYKDNDGRLHDVSVTHKFCGMHSGWDDRWDCNTNRRKL